VKGTIRSTDSYYGRALQLSVKDDISARGEFREPAAAKAKRCALPLRNRAPSFHNHAKVILRARDGMVF
jgi:hypothetical protein